MRNALHPLLLALFIALATAAHANPALHGTWSAPSVNGQPLVVTFDASGGGKLNGAPIKWQTLGGLLLIQAQNGQVGTYSFEVTDRKLSVSGGDLQGVAVLTPGSAAADAVRAKQKKEPAKNAPATAAAGGTGRELVGKWCNLAQFTANAGGSSRMECFELRGDGSYSYAYEGSMSGSSGSTASQSSDAGRWTYTGSQLTAQSRSGKVATYTLEKRNHPKNNRDPMICLDGTCYVTFYNKPAW